MSDVLPFSLFELNFSFEVGSHYVALAVLKLALKTALVQIVTCLMNIVIKGLHLQVDILCLFVGELRSFTLKVVIGKCYLFL